MMDDAIKYGDNDHYDEGLHYELGIGRKQDYKKALYHYKEGKREGHVLSIQKVKDVHLNWYLVLPVMILSVVSLIISGLQHRLWIGLFITGALMLVASLIDFNRHWYKKGYANIVNKAMFFLSVVGFIPASTLLPYAYGIATLPAALLLIIGFFTLGFGIVALIANFEKRNVVILITGIFITIISIWVYFIPTNEIKYDYKEIEGGILIEKYYGDEKNVTIPRTLNNQLVIEIAPYAFSNTSVESIYVPDHVKTIHAFAFANMRKLEVVEIAPEVDIAHGLFYGSGQLKEVVLPNIDAIPAYTFYETGIESFTLDESIKHIGAYAFYKTANLNTFDFNENLISIGPYAFAGNPNLSTIELPNSVVSVGEGAFSNMINLISFKFSNQMTMIAPRLFKNNNGLETFEIPEHIQAIGEEAFMGTSNLHTLTLHDDITHIGSSAFRNMVALDSITLPEKLEVISSYLLFGATSIKEIEVPLGIKVIEHSAFRGATSLKEVVLPEGLEVINTSAFESTALESVVLPSTLHTLGVRVFAENKQLTSIEIPSGVTQISDGLFYNATNLKTAIFHGQITSIGHQSFRGAAHLETLQFVNAVEFIGNYAFYNTTALQSFDFGDDLVSIGDYAFYRSAIQTAILPDTVRSIGSVAFASNAFLNTVRLHGSVIQVGNNTFFNNSNLTIYIVGSEIPDTWNEKFNPQNIPIIFE